MFVNQIIYRKFYASLNLLKMFYSFEPSLPKDVELLADKEKPKYKISYIRQTEILRRTWGYKVMITREPLIKTTLIRVYNKKPWNMRFVASYYSLYGIRW